MKIVIIDDDKFITSALRTILEAGGEITVEGVGYDGSDAVRLYQEKRPDVLLMDIQMKEMSGLAAAKQILQEDPAAKILLLTTFSDKEYIVRALKYGVKGYILKQDYDSILPAIRAVYRGQGVFGEEVSSCLPDLLKEKEPFDYQAHGITEKEHEVIKLVAKGLNNKEIAAKLFLSEGTVRNYISDVLDKLELRDRTQLAVHYLTKSY